MRFKFEHYPNRHIDVIYFETSNPKNIMELLRGGKLTAGFLNPKYVCKNTLYLVFI
jgi:hypothetical protein